jgi:hypothetical protein
MNVVIASYLKDKILASITWADRVVGLVRTLTFTQEGESSVVKKSIPISCDLEVSQRDCISNKQHHVVPDDKLKALIYFEDGGAVPTGQGNRGLIFTSTIKLVCWMNLKKLGQTSCSASAFAEIQLIELLNGLGVVNLNPNYGIPINAVKVTEISIDPKTAAIFSKYTYDETKVQYLTYPSDYFSFTLKIQFEVPKGCVDNDWVNAEIECLDNSPS